MVTMILSTLKIPIYHFFRKMHFKSILKICFDSLRRAGPAPQLGQNSRGGPGGVGVSAPDPRTENRRTGPTPCCLLQWPR